jgi:hypothetical protein
MKFLHSEVIFPRYIQYNLLLEDSLTMFSKGLPTSCVTCIEKNDP